MATIHALRPAPRCVPSKPLERTAEIILFPGVRYERWAEAAVKPKRAARVKSSGKSRVERDHLVIVIKRSARKSATSA
jgi:hypothetical protein